MWSETSGRKQICMHIFVDEKYELRLEYLEDKIMQWWPFIHIFLIRFIFFVTQQFRRVNCEESLGWLRILSAESISVSLWESLIDNLNLHSEEGFWINSGISWAQCTYMELGKNECIRKGKHVWFSCCHSWFIRSVAYNSFVTSSWHMKSKSIKLHFDWTKTRVLQRTNLVDKKFSMLNFYTYLLNSKVYSKGFICECQNTNRIWLPIPDL